MRFAYNAVAPSISSTQGPGSPSHRTPKLGGGSSGSCGPPSPVWSRSPLLLTLLVVIEEVGSEAA